MGTKNRFGAKRISEKLEELGEELTRVYRVASLEDNTYMMAFARSANAVVTGGIEFMADKEAYKGKRFDATRESVREMLNNTIMTHMVLARLIKSWHGNAKVPHEELLLSEMEPGVRDFALQVKKKMSDVGDLAGRLTAAQYALGSSEGAVTAAHFVIQLFTIAAPSVDFGGHYDMLKEKGVDVLIWGAPQTFIF